MALGETTEERHIRLDKNEDFSLFKIRDSGAIIKKKGDYHYLINGIYDYWPRTGLFIHRKTKKRSRGYKNLINKLKI